MKDIVRISENPWIIPPVDVVEQGWEAVENYCRENPPIVNIKSATKR